MGSRVYPNRGGEMKNLIVSLVTVLCCLSLSSAVAAKTKNVDCSKKSLASELSNLDKAEVNVVNVVGNCIEDLVISDFKDLTLVGDSATNLSATLSTVARRRYTRFPVF